MHNKLPINFLPEEGPPIIFFEPSELIDFRHAWDWQREWQEKLFLDPSSSQAIWILQHYPCYTLGRGGDLDNLLFDLGKSPFDFYQIDRGGEATHHLPGQLVTYLVLNLRNYKTDLNWYLRELENVLIEVLGDLGLYGYRINGMTGVWCNNEKVASIGISCRRWITLHGMALNVNCDLAGFNQIVPCGLNGIKTGRLSNWLPDLKLPTVYPLIKKSLNKHFGLLCTH